MRCRGILVQIVLTLVLLSSTTQAASQSNNNFFNAESSCSRTFIYHERAHPLDSSRKNDAEGLRPIFKNYSNSEELLNQYQQQINSSFFPAYIATGGILITLAGLILTDHISSELGRRDTQRILLSSGLAIVAGGYAYGQYRLLAKEKTLENAVQRYNDSVSEQDKIRVQVAPLTTEKGGEVRTQVPF